MLLQNGNLIFLDNESPKINRTVVENLEGEEEEEEDEEPSNFQSYP